MRDLRVALVQSMLHWEDAAANRAMFTQKFASLKGTTDLVVLPEMFSTGFSMRSAELAEPMDGPTVTWMKEQAWELDAAIYGSAIITEDGKCYNRGLFVKADGTVIPYDKRHLFRMAEEIRHYTPGATGGGGMAWMEAPAADLLRPAVPGVSRATAATTMPCCTWRTGRNPAAILGVSCSLLAPSRTRAM